MSCIRQSFRAHRTLLFMAALLILIPALLSVDLPAAQAATGTDFYSTFDTDSLGWNKVTGNWYLTGTGYYKCDGLADKYASAKHSGTYTDFVFSTRLKRTSNAGPEVIVFARGTPSPLSTNRNWDDAYELWYSSLFEDLSIVKRVNGFQLTLLGWTAIGVKSDDWNTIKVVMYDDILAFYVNGTLVYLNDDPSPIESGQVGIGLYDGGPGDKLLVNYAKLRIIPGFPSLSLRTLGLPSYSVPEGEPIQLR